MKKISSIAYTGFVFKYNGEIHTVGLMRKIDGKNLIVVRVKINETSCITIQLSTNQLNKMLKHSEYI